MRRLRPLGLLVALVAGVACRPALAGEEVRVAVAASFAPALRELAEPFYQHTGHRLVISAASTGALYAQIRHGAPYDVFLAADAARPRRLEQEGVAVPGSRFTYARGRLVLWSARAGAVTGPEALQGAAARPIALANPRIA
ncbi:MAG TPA: molybdate ABC transporter substrate-binding protein, partial [Thermoanaerobaculia bacterium]|nr:molybdate ABC transporter substrate-binding protein [Thermoanaerobaculia bacterium]